jgi:hypothetical protein
MPEVLHPQNQRRQTMKRFLMALALSCALSTTALAGNIPTSGITPPPPPEDTQTTSSDSVSFTDYAAPESEDSLLTMLLTIIGVI